MGGHFIRAEVFSLRGWGGCSNDFIALVDDGQFNIDRASRLLQQLPEVAARRCVREFFLYSQKTPLSDVMPSALFLVDCGHDRNEGNATGDFKKPDPQLLGCFDN